MNIKLLLFTIAFFTAKAAFSQDATTLPSILTLKEKFDPLGPNENFPTIKFDNHPGNSIGASSPDKKEYTSIKRKITLYRDSRLGISSQSYSRFQKNKYAAAAFTKNTNKILIRPTPSKLNLMNTSKIKLIKF